MTEGIFSVREFMSDRVVAIEPDATVGDAMARMEQEGIHELPVMTNSNLRGWISYTTILRRGGVPPATKVSHAMEQPPKILKDSDLIDAAGLMIQSGIRALPVMNSKGLVVGILSRTDILKAAARIPSVSGLALESVMKRELETTTENDLVDRAVARLRDHNINQLLVTDGDGKLSGYVALEDLLRAHSAEHAPDALSKTRRQSGAGGLSKVARVEIKSFVKDAPVLAGKAKVRDAIKLMQQKAVNFVVVADGEEALGVVSRSNVVERVAALKPTAGVPCQIGGLGDHDSSELNEIYVLAQATLKKISTEIRPDFLSLHYKVFKAKEGGDSKYALSIHLGTEGRFWTQKADAWDPVDAARLAFDLLQRRVGNVKEMRLERRKGPRRKTSFYEAASA